MIVVMLLPIVGSLASELQMLHTIGAYDNVVFLMFMKGGFLGTNFLIFYATFKGISWEYAEAAFIDGASHARVLFTIMIPLAMTTVTAVSYTHLDVYKRQLYAKFTLKTFTVTFEVNGGTAVDSITLEKGALIIAPVVTREGYEFGGWYTDEALTNAYEFGAAGIESDQMCIRDRGKRESLRSKVKVGARFCFAALV